MRTQEAAMFTGVRAGSEGGEDWEFSQLCGKHGGRAGRSRGLKEQ